MFARPRLTLAGGGLCLLLLWLSPRAPAADRDDYGRRFRQREPARRQFIPGRVGDGYRRDDRWGDRDDRWDERNLPDRLGPLGGWHGRDDRDRPFGYRPYWEYEYRYPRYHGQPFGYPGYYYGQPFGYPRYYGQPFGYPGYYPRFSPYYDRDRRSYDDYFDAYRKAEQYEQLQRLVRRRESRLHRQHLHLMNDGLAAFHRGDYRQAANQFMAAAESDQGDPASRLHAAHALMAVGDYRSAVVLLRRAFQLQPKIVALAYDIRDDYGDVDDFESQLARLRDEAIRAERDEDLWVLLGYVRFYSGDRAGAYAACRKALELSPRDPLAARLAKASMTAGLAADG